MKERVESVWVEWVLNTFLESLTIGYWKQTGNSGGLILDTSRKKTLETRCPSHSPTAKLKVRPRHTRPTLFTTNVKSRPSFRSSVENKPTPGQDSRQRSSTTSATRINPENLDYRSNDGFLIC